MAVTARAATRSLLRAAASNHRIWFRRFADANGGFTEPSRYVELVVDRRSATIPFPSSRAPERLDRVLARARQLKLRTVGCWALGEDRVLGTRLLARGFEWGWQPHWMARGLTRISSSPAAHEVVALSQPPPPEVPYASPGDDPPSARHLAVEADGIVVGHVIVHPWRGVAGIYDMGVAPDHRRRGIGTALTLAACHVGRELGCSHAILNATIPELYRGAGFKSIGLGQTWWLHPGSRPTPRQGALVEAIGFGDVRALERLRLTDSELEADIHGPGPPLAVAVVTGQVAAADWLLSRRPDLLSRALDDRGCTLLHRAVELDREPIVRLALARGADTSARDTEYGGTPLGWAEHLGRARIAGLLR